MVRSRTPASSTRHLLSAAAGFAHDEEGGATIWNVTWLLVFAGMAGLAIDASNGYRNMSISQSTSDAAALAGVMQLPNPVDGVPFDPAEDAYDDTVKAEAREYAQKNMEPSVFGNALTDEHILIGHWDTGTRTFTPGHAFETPDALSVNAVRVYLSQDEEARGNGVPTALMHMVGMSHWDVSTTATAMSGYPLCAAHGFMAHRKYCQTSNSTYGKDVCLWADEGFFLKNGNEWQGNIASTPPGANNDGISEGNYEDGDFVLREEAMALDVQFVEDIATLNDGAPGIAYDILRGGSYYTQKTTTGTDGAGDPIRTAPGGDVIRLQTDTIGTLLETGWLETEPSIQVASLDGFASIAGLLGAATHASRGSGNIPPGCPESRSNGSRVEPIGNYNRDIFGIEAGGADEFPDVQFAVDSDGNAVVESTRDLDPHKIYYHDGPNPLTIEGSLHGVVVVTREAIIIKGGSVLTDVTLVSLEDRRGGVDGLSMNGSVTFGTATGTCDEEGGVKMYTMGSVSGSSGAQFNGAFIAAGGSVGFAANADAEQGVSVYSAGNIFHTSNNTITTCGVPITFDRDNLRHSLVD